MTAAEHLAWAKGRALEYLDRGEWRDGVVSMISDLSKHPDLGGITAVLALNGLMCQDAQSARKWVEGFLQ